MTETELDNFEFKPISEGLGFHRKPSSASADGDDEAFSFSSLGAPLGNTRSVPTNAADPETAFSSKAKVRHNSKGVSDLIAALPPALDFLDENDRQPAAVAGGLAKSSASASSVSTSVASTMSHTFLKMPIGREDYKQSSGQAAVPSATRAKPSLGTPAVGSTGSAPAAGTIAAGAAAAGAMSSVDANLAKLGNSFPHMGRLAGQPAAQALRDGGISLNKAQAKESAKGSAKEHGIAFHFGSAILDTLVVLGVGCVLLAVLLGLTGANLVALLENSKTDAETITLLGVLFVTSGLLYTLAARSFLGATLGEWSYELRIGSAQRRARWFYPVLVLWRGLLVAATGFIFFPIVSALVGHDVLKWLTGLEIMAIEPAQ